MDASVAGSVTGTLSAANTGIATSPSTSPTPMVSSSFPCFMVVLLGLRVVTFLDRADQRHRGSFSHRFASDVGSRSRRMPREPFDGPHDLRESAGKSRAKRRSGAIKSSEYSHPCRQGRRTRIGSARPVRRCYGYALL